VSCIAFGANIEDFGAVEGVDTWDAACINSESFLKALSAANASSTDRTVEWPADKTFYMRNIEVNNLHDITIHVNGDVKINDDINKWEDDSGRGVIDISDSTFITVLGHGTVDGQGQKWWRKAYTGVDNRWYLFQFTRCQYLEFYDVHLINSQKFHLKAQDSLHVMIDGITIFVDDTIMRGIRKEHESVMFPLNTDGIDLGVWNATVRNCNITNFDDAIVAKPCNQENTLCKCSGDFKIYNNTITYSVGLAIGSVSPSETHNCVRNVHFYNNSMYRPLKAMYIKSNPGDSGDAIIENIQYEDLYVKQAVWWLLWVGPQQQRQPGQDSTGCNFMLPFIPICPTQPLVTIRNITFRNVRAEETLPIFEGPGCVLCNASNPCVDMNFHDVNVTFFEGDIDDIREELNFWTPGVIFPTKQRSDNISLEYLTQNAYGSVTGYVAPIPCLDDSCFWDGTAKH